MGSHRWAKSPTFQLSTGDVHGYWICPCGARESMAEFPVPPYGKCGFKWPEVRPEHDQPRSIEELEGCYRRSPIVWVLASGASLNHVDPEFFTDKLVVGINEVFRDWPVDFLLAHHQECCQEALDAGETVVTSEFHCGIYAWGRMPLRGRYYTYKHVDSPHFTNIDLSVMDEPDHLVMSSCTVAEAVHFAHHLGAATIILCGVDGGSIDGKYNYDGYNGGHGTNTDHIRVTLPLLQKVVDEVRRRGTAVYSLNPFLDLGLEGHTFARS